MTILRTYDSPKLIVADDINFEVLGEGFNAGVYGEDSLIFLNGFGSDVTVESQDGPFAAGLVAGEDLWIQNIDNDGDPGLYDGSFYGNIKVSARGEDGFGAVGMLAGLDDIFDGGSESAVLGVDYDLRGSVNVQAEAGYAYGLYGEDAVYIGRDLNADLTVLSGNPTWNEESETWSFESLHDNGDNEEAYGIWSGGSIYVGFGDPDLQGFEDEPDLDDLLNHSQDNVGNLNGIFNVWALDDYAYGLRAEDNIYVANDVDGSFNVTSGYEASTLFANEDAYGLSTGEDIWIGNDLKGEFNVRAYGNDAYGLHTDRTFYGPDNGSDIWIGNDVNTTMTVIAGGGAEQFGDTGDNAYGIRSGDNIFIGNDLKGTFFVKAYDDNAYGLRTGNRGDDLFVGGDVTADMTVIAGNGTVEEPLQLLSEGEGESDPFAGWTVDEENLQDGGDNDGAYGLRASRDIEIVGDLEGSFNIWALDDDAYGVYSSDGNIMAGSVSATMNVMAGWDGSGEDNSGAYGLSADDNVLIAGDYSGSINSKAHSSMPGSAYGMYAGEDIVIGGTFDGSIMASDSMEAYGMYAGGSVSGTGEDALNIQDGTITASVDGEGTAIGILARGGMNLDISGESLISATSQDDGVNGSARALSSRNNYDDTVTIQDSSVLIGNVMLGGGEDVMTVIGTEDGNPDIEQVARLNGGPGPSDDDQLVFRNWSGTLGDEVVNWETIDVTEGSVVNLGGSKTDTDNPLSDGEDEPFAAIMSVSPNTIVTMTIDETSEVQAMGESAGDYVLAGDLYNYGHLNLSDGAADDTFSIVADGEDGGGNYYAASDLSLDADLSVSGVDSDEYLDVAGEVSGQTTVTINNVESHVAPTVGDGIGIIFAGDVEEGNDEAFVLGNPNDFGPFAVEIAQADIPEDGFAWYAQSPGYREEAAAIQAVTPFMNRLGYESVMKFHERRAYGWFRNDSGEHESWWIRATGSKYRQGMEGDAAAEFEGYTGWMQVGTDLIADGDKGGRFDLGIFAGAGYGWAEVDGLRSDKAGELSQTAYGVGAYMSIHERGNWYLDAVAQAIYNDLAIDYLTEDEQKPDAWSYVASLETGGCIPMGTGFRIEPQAQLVYQYTEDMTLSTLVGDVSIEDHQGLQGRLSLTGVIGAPEATTYPFFEVTAIKDFSEDNSVKYLDGSVELKTSPEDWYLGGALGLTRTPQTDAGFGYYVKAAAMYGMDDLDSYNYSLMAGLRKSF